MGVVRDFERVFSIKKAVKSSFTAFFMNSILIKVERPVFVLKRLLEQLLLACLQFVRL
ncbi:hypothetical protein CLW00_10843 [Mongoliibacter ruber]|uniref:Uncharacterized protein n=1 Tax=Mongoliibacter ruber TaxID=1750599 RepID=A0A2T0WIN5_9BACT|nr:hypothetical protein CLW00_10843 [Mongoliibacter ruber]